MMANSEVTNKSILVKPIQILDMDDLAFLAIDRNICTKVGYSFENLLKTEFQIKLIGRRVVLEGILPDGPSNTSPMDGRNQPGDDFNG